MTKINYYFCFCFQMKIIETGSTKHENKMVNKLVCTIASYSSMCYTKSVYCSEYIFIVDQQVNQSDNMLSIIEINIYSVFTFRFVFLLSPKPNKKVKWKKTHTRTFTQSLRTVYDDDDDRVKSYLIILNYIDASVTNGSFGDCAFSSIFPHNSLQLSTAGSYKRRRSADVSKHFDIHIISDNTSERSIDWSRIKQRNQFTSVFLL